MKKITWDPFYFTMTNFTRVLLSFRVNVNFDVTPAAWGEGGKVAVQKWN